MKEMQKKQITLRLPYEVYEALFKEANEKHITVNELMNVILYSHYL